MGKGKARPAPVPTAIDAFMETLLFLGGRESNGRFSSQQEERKCLLQIEPDFLIVMAEIAGRHVLSEIEAEIAAAQK